MRGTVMQDTKTPLTTWFWGAYLVSTLTPGMSAVQFQRQLGLSRYETAFNGVCSIIPGILSIPAPFSDFDAQSARKFKRLRPNSLRNGTGNYFNGTGNVSERTGNFLG